jgi:trimethylamine--corrinoid protein Co-methyltransferase
MINYATLLTSQQVERVHQASLEILASIGLKVRNPKARDYYRKHGCQVDSETQVVKFPTHVVKEFSQAFPSKFTFHGRDSKFDRTIPDDSPVIVTASSAPDLIDPVNGEQRRSTSEDIARIAHLINELPGYDVFSISTLADDAPPGQFTLSRLYPALKYCLKPVRSTTVNAEDTEKVLRLGSLIAGSEQAYLDHPFITHHFCPVVSPLTMDFDSTEMLIYFVERGLPVYPSIVPNGGLTSPMTLAGTLAQGNAEFLSAAVLMQMIRPGTPLIYSTLPTIADMRTGAYASGGIECGMLHMAFAQMAQYYAVPCGGYIGLTNAKINDAQSGFETGLSTMGGMLAGADMLNMGGLLDALKSFDYPKAIIDGEIALMLKRVKRGIEFNEKNLALEAIAEVGLGGSFISHLNTVQNMKTATLLPKIADRDTRVSWEARGSKDAQGRALHMLAEILRRESQAAFTPDIEVRIHSEFQGLVEGNLIIPVGL